MSEHEKNTTLPEGKVGKKYEQTAEEMNQEIAALKLQIARDEAENARLAIEERKLNMQDIRNRIDKSKLTVEDKESKARASGQALIQEWRGKASVQSRCNHKKGGDGAAGVVGGRGDSEQYSIFRHKFANQDTWVRCSRCGKTWKPVRKADFKDIVNEKTGEVLTALEQFMRADNDYNRAMEWHTKNSTSTSYGFQWGTGVDTDGEVIGGNDVYRKVMRNVNLH
jgi:regulator of replication initiation timing